MPSPIILVCLFWFAVIAGVIIAIKLADKRWDRVYKKKKKNEKLTSDYDLKELARRSILNQIELRNIEEESSKCRQDDVDTLAQLNFRITKARKEKKLILARLRSYEDGWWG